MAGGELHTTRDAIGRTLDFLRDNPDMSPHLEVETYTWEMLPPALQEGDLNQAIARELRWVRDELGQ